MYTMERQQSVFRTPPPGPDKVYIPKVPLVLDKIAFALTGQSCVQRRIMIVDVY